VAQNFNTDEQKKIYSKNDLTNLKLADNRTVSDEIALTVSSVGENLNLRRAIILNIPHDTHLGHYLHGQVDPVDGCYFGRFVGLVSFKLHSDEHKLQVCFD
jgi:translation elongation factor EF-Ts